jgi:hypothetical protein
MKKKSTGLIFLLALSLILMIPVLSMTPVAAERVTHPTAKPGVIDWAEGGYTNYQTLTWNPEYLKLYTLTTVPTETTVIVQGKDTYGQNVEARVVLNGTHDVPIQPEMTFIFNDTHTTPPIPVAFAEITGIFQQNGTHNVLFMIYTEPEPFEEYIGEYHKSTGWLPGQYAWGSTNNPAVYGSLHTHYLVGHGEDTTLTVQDFPVEPSNPDPLKILINWHETDGDLFPESSEQTLVSTRTAWIWIEGLDQNGNKLAVNTTIPVGVNGVYVNAGSHTWSSICKVIGNGPDSYYILTEPIPERTLFTYTLRIDHITIQPDCYDILANPQAPGGAGSTNITVALRDQDGNLIHAASGIVVNFATSGGRIQPSSDVWINPCHITATTNLTADTNARTVKVTADANVLVCDYAPAMNLFAWTELTFDGINSVQFTGGWPIHMMMWGWNSWNGTAWFSTFTGPVPPKPWLPEWLGGPIAGSETPPYKLDGPIYEVMIPLYVGCNLISTPVCPILCNTYMSGYPDGAEGIPMSLLFGNTSATTCIEAIWWYQGGAWDHYIPGVDGTDQYFTDGVGYWIKAEKPCTLEISGVLMENAPFTPPLYTLTAESWNLMGVTSLTGISLTDYCGDARPVWVYQAQYGTWYRNPSWGLWPGQAFWVYGGSDGGYVAP